MKNKQRSPFNAKNFKSTLLCSSGADIKTMFASKRISKEMDAYIVREALIQQRITSMIAGVKPRQVVIWDDSEYISPANRHELVSNPIHPFEGLAPSLIEKIVLEIAGAEPKNTQLAWFGRAIRESKEIFDHDVSILEPYGAECTEDSIVLTDKAQNNIRAALKTMNSDQAVELKCALLRFALPQS